MPEHAVAAGLLLVATLDLGLAADRLLVGDLGVWVTIAAPNLRLSRSAMTAMWASPGRDEELLADRAALDPGGRLLLEHPGQGGAHLVEVGLGLGLDGDHERRVRERQRVEDERLLAARERVARLGHGQLGDRADLAGLELADRLLLLAVDEEELADALVLAPGRVPGMIVRADRAPRARGCTSAGRRTGRRRS